MHLERVVPSGGDRRDRLNNSSFFYRYLYGQADAPTYIMQRSFVQLGSSVRACMRSMHENVQVFVPSLLLPYVHARPHQASLLSVIRSPKSLPDN
jgi:hypothetical protein